MDDDALYVKIRIRKQIKNKKKLYRASLLTKDKKEKVIGWFVTRAEATNIANITRDMTNDTKETKMTAEKTYHREKNIETVHKRLHNLSSYTGIYKRLNYFSSLKIILEPSK